MSYSPRLLAIIAYYDLVGYNMKEIMITKTNIRRLIYHVRHYYMTPNNVVIAVAFVIGAGWAWGSVGVMQRNFELQKSVDQKQRQEQLLDLQTQSLAFEQNYYKTAEYQELAARERLGLAMAGEKVLVLPPNSASAKAADTPQAKLATVPAKPPTHMVQWMNFLFGGNRPNLQK